MECVWDDALSKRVEELPEELLEIIRSAGNEAYLTALTQYALNAVYTDLLFAHCESLFAHICASSKAHTSQARWIALLGRVVPFAAHLTACAVEALSSEPYLLGESGNDDEDLLYLLGLFRLLKYDCRTFVKFVQPAQLAALLETSSRPVVYMAVRILQIQLNGADHWFEEMVRRYLGEDTVGGDMNGSWDAGTIDYRFLTLWEEQRRENVVKLIDEVAQQQNDCRPTRRLIPAEAFHLSTSLVGNFLFLRAISSSLPPSHHEFVNSPTMALNLQNITTSLRSANPLLLTGLAGSGKTMLVRHVAQCLGKADSMVTLHLNEQSDAKLLIGIYTTGDTPGTFVWRPGVLTTAVQEGRWVLIEDLDRAPNEIIGTLLPLIERHELLIPNRKQTVHAAPGFRIIATVRSTINHRGDEIRPLAQMLGARHWRNVSVSMPTMSEQKTVAEQLYPVLTPLLPQFVAVYERIVSAKQNALLAGQNRTGILRTTSPRDLLKWCHRTARLLGRGSFTSVDVDNIFLEATDCFVGALPNGTARTLLASIIAEELRIDPQRRDFLLNEREVNYKVDKNVINVGRYELPRASQKKSSASINNAFSTNPHTSRLLEQAAAAVVNREPLLLVGETGVGKTTAVQHLADHLGKKLEAFNLSQQSEAGDLLGGFKPVTARSLVIPMKDEFDELFAAGFSMSKNRQFLELLHKQMTKSNWKSVCTLWRQALKMVDQQRKGSPPREGETPSKKRKIESRQVSDFHRWDMFATKVMELERRLAAGSDAFAFSFVEGNIVRAVRNGDWVLLDEINLASPDTLEAIADLLDPSTPSLLLTEAGNIERIEAHPEFRVFAAMNPATDVGKKDLPAGIRSRFTELYIESPDKDIKSLQSIVRSYLRNEATIDQTIALDVSVVYKKIIGLAEQGRLVDGAGQKPHFSLRTLTRTLAYAKYIAPLCNIRRALFEGFQMSFLTFLDQESAHLIEPLLEEHLFAKRTNVRSELKKALRKPEDGQRYVQGFPGSKHWVRLGELDPEVQPHYILTPFIRDNLENLVRATSTRRFPVLIQGPTSSGKTSMIEYLAKQTGHNFVRVNNHEHTDLQEYLGTYVSGTNGRLQFQEGVLVKALREGHWIVLDELNLAPTDVLEALNRLLDDNRELLIPETQEVVRPHDNFMLFATQNPAGLYGGRKALSRAFRNRFLELHFDDIPIHELQEILHRRTELPESRCERIVKVYKELSILRQENRLFEQKSFATLRDLFRWAFRQNDTIEQLAANGFMLLGERVRKIEERQALKSVIEKVMSANGARITIDESSLYGHSCPEIQQYSNDATSQGIVWTKAMRRLYLLVSRAIANNEPVLLVGETGCGKTTVCQMLADARKKQLHTVNAHQNTETGDLIGSQRPVRNRATIETQLRGYLVKADLLQGLQTPTALSTDALTDAYDRALSSLADSDRAVHCHSVLHREIQSSRTRFKALFEWSDGSIVQAMRNGSFFLMDEISLADDSVLERINSVLESQRSILLAEKGSLDSFITAAPGFQFFATMNPGGDYGKRELSPALRNRFTEIWVPSLSDTDDIIQIVDSKLVGSAQKYTSAIVAFSMWFKREYNTSANNSVSIRDALAWIEFIGSQMNMDVPAAVVHGAAMVYIDTLGANPAGLMALTGSDLAFERSRCLDELGRLLKVDASATYFAPIEVRTTAKSFDIGSFSVRRWRSTEQTPAYFTFDAPTSRSNAMRVVRAMQLFKPIMLEGSPGVGKTALVTAVAHAVGVPLTRINLSDQTDLIDLFGADAPVDGAETGMFAWRDAPFLRALKNGEWVLLDEMNLASQTVLEGLNACLDHRGEVYVPELGQTFSRHPDFRLFAAQNPHHQGGGRKGLPASFVNRFTVVYADSFKLEDLDLICQRSFVHVDAGLIDNVVRFVNKLETESSQRRSFGANGGPWEFNLRDIARWLSLAQSSEGFVRAGSDADFVDLLFLQRFRSYDDREYVRKLFESVFRDAPPLADMISSVSPLVVQVGLGLLHRNPVSADMTGAFPTTGRKPQQLRVLQSVMLCVQQRWPVILAGASGSGKTSLISSLAATVGVSVVTIAMNAETDSMDLIGGYEQSDQQRQDVEARRQLRGHLELLAKSDLIGSSAEQMLDILARLDSSTASQFRHALRGTSSPDVISLLQILDHTPAQVDKARFEWVDGLLIEALEHGHWVVLDNANLCSASVLDRLNSLLEPDGTLVINEHTEADGVPRVIQPHQEFRVFLTIDPKYGELSRAMRNRAVELFLPLETGHASTLDPLQPESAMARFRQLKVLSQKDGLFPKLLNTAQDHLGLHDQVMTPRFERQLHAGMLGMGSLLTQSIQSTYRSSSEGRLVVFYKTALSHTQVSADFACVQTIHPLNNQPLVQQSPQHFAQALLEALIHETSLQFDPVVNAIDDLRSNQASSQRIKRLERSIVAKTRTHGKDSGPMKAGLIDTVSAALRTILQWTREIDGASIELHDLRMALRRLGACWWHFVKVMQARDFDQALFNAWLSSLNITLMEMATSAPETFKALLQHVGQAFAAFTPTVHPFAGRACATLWKALRPTTPSHISQLDAVLAFEQLVSRFDVSCSQFALPLASLADLRVSFARALETARPEELRSLSARLEHIMPVSSPTGVDESPITRNPLFVKSFERLCQHMAIWKMARHSTSATNSAMLEILATRSTKSSTVALQEQDVCLPQVGFKLLKQALPVSTPSGRPGDDDQPFAQTLLTQLRITSNVSIGDLDLLESETSVLACNVGLYAHLLSANDLEILDTCLERLLRSVLEALSQAIDESDMQLTTEAVSVVLDGGHLVDGSADIGALFPLPNSTDQGILSWPCSHLGAVAKYIRGNYSVRDQHTWQLDAARAWTRFAAVALTLYLPAEPFDPALKPRLDREMHRHVFSELSNEQQAVLQFRAMLTGSDQSLRARLLAAEIDTLGQEPLVDEVCRPQTSDMPQLQSDFDSLTRVVHSLTSGLEESREVPPRDSIPWSNLERIRTRLAEQYRSYDDLTGPVVGFIDCLRMAQCLRTHADHLASEKPSAKSLSSITPFVSASFESWQSDKTFIGAMRDEHSLRERVFILSVLSLRCQNQPFAKSSPELKFQVERQLLHLYDQWRVTLDQDQKSEMAKSSLYRFIGDEDVQDEESPEELEALFPTGEDTDREPAIKPDYNGQELALELAEIHCAIFNSNNEVSRPPLTDLMQKLGHIATTSTYGEDTKSAIPTILLGLESAAASTFETLRTPYNIYRDANVPEVKKLVRLVQKIVGRFETLHSAWPEHATPVDVLRLCDRIYTLNHTDPLIKLLPHLEKLHSTMNDWQRIASKEFIAEDVYEELTDTIIRWRQVELSSWAGLLEHETVACRKASSSWWYIAYENIILAANNLRSGPEELRRHAMSLLKTLEIFMSGCGLGEFGSRLGMLRAFEAHLACHVAENPSLGIVQQALANFNAYHDNFTHTIEESLMKGRAEVEKQIKNVIQVASWKDRNVAVLKQSAQTSHKRLLRFVRKYRRLLAQPVAPLIHSIIPAKSVVQHQDSAWSECHMALGLVDLNMSGPTLSNITAWAARPDRFRNVAATVSLLQKKFNRSLSYLDTPERLLSFTNDLQSSIKELQKATPAVLTEKNKAIVQHLKTRKRRLLADVMKDLRLMGFQSNLSDDVLQLQNALHVVLAHAPTLTLSLEASKVPASEAHFHQLLSIFPFVRESARKHSEDLTPAETARCLALLESMLQNVILQRKSFSEGLQTISNLKATMGLFEAFAYSTDPAVAGSLSQPEITKLRVRSLATMTQTCQRIIDNQARLSNTDHSDVVNELERIASAAAKLALDMADSPLLPAGICDKFTVAYEAALQVLCKDIVSMVQTASEMHPELEPTLCQLAKWTDFDASAAGCDVDNDAGDMDVDLWITDLSAIFDQTLGSIEGLGEEAGAETDPAAKSWLLMQQKKLDRQLKVLRMDHIGHGLLSLLTRLQHISSVSTGALPNLSAACRALHPILFAFTESCEKLCHTISSANTETSKMAFQLATSFIQLAQKGFCTPSEKESGKNENTGELESGTGLGDGEGAEDISKDVGDDEDLGDLGQQPQGEEQKDEMKDEKDAVDMADQELEGGMDEGEAESDEDEEENGDQDGEDAEVEEEAGDVDDLGPSTIDEKMWDEGKDENLRDKQTNSGKGAEAEDDLGAVDQENKGDAGDDEDQDETEAGADEDEHVEQHGLEKVDPHTQEQSNLDLPEDLNMEGETAAEDETSDLESIPDDNFDTAANPEQVDDESRSQSDIEPGPDLEESEGSDEAEQNGKGEDTQDDVEEGDDTQSDILMQDDEKGDEEQMQDDDVFGETGHGSEQKQDQAKHAQDTSAMNEEEADLDPGTNDAKTKSGTTGVRSEEQGEDAGADENAKDEAQLPYKQIGEALDEWYRQHKKIQDAQQRAELSETKADPVDMADVEFEHLPDAEAHADTQALGAASTDQATAIDEESGLPHNDQEKPEQMPLDEPNDDKHESDEDQLTRDPTQVDINSSLRQDESSKAFVGEPKDQMQDIDMEDALSITESETVDHVDEQLLNTHISHEDPANALTIQEARALWTEHEESTRSLALMLTEHLRLILQPTQATKMRGDFRTGKRLNIKRIIPYIASSYKRDKIWMRRSVPSKRSYQIILAIDDSQSMAESDSRNLAFDTLALVAKSMSMLEVGQLSVVGFGEDVKVAHDFQTPFTSETGAEVFRHFTFAQTKTNVRKLLAESIELFRSARLKATGSASDLWQLQLIISDGVCEDHPSIRQLVRQAHEERIMMVFIVVDSTAQDAIISDGPRQSILDLQTAEFTKDAAGEMQLKMIKYLDTFPFKYYLVVRDVQELPAVLAGALRQWFAEVVESGA